MAPPTAAAPPDLSVVAPARDEAENLPRLIADVEKALAPAGFAFELIIVDDGSTDGSREVVRACMAERPWLRCIALRGSSSRSGGQSAAFCAGFRAARGRWVAGLDADLQNDPAELPAMLALLDHSGADLVQGDRSRARRDPLVRRAGSQVGRLYRRLVLADLARDSSCSLRVMRREVALALPLDLAGSHRFVPALARQLGYRVTEMPAAHRPRRAGRSKYGLGLGRALPGLVDGLGVRWLGRRRRSVVFDEVER
jgi:dolichol-phosphate mannosyltransferase